jgi:flagellin-like protein
MKLKQLFTDDDAVSPVIGVILMVAITVILAAVIATFVIGLGDSAGNNAPSASFNIEYTEDSSAGVVSGDDGYVEIAHQSGTSIPAQELEVNGDSITLLDDGSWENEAHDVGGSSGTYGATSSISSGDSMFVSANDDFEVTLIWSPPEEDTSSELQSETGPAN